MRSPIIHHSMQLVSFIGCPGFVVEPTATGPLITCVVQATGEQETQKLSAIYIETAAIESA